MSSPKKSYKKSASRTPIVWLAYTPVGFWPVRSLPTCPCPSRNITGFALYEAPMGGKWLELLSEIAPGLKQATMFNPDTAIVSTFMPSFETAARSLKFVLITARVHGEVEIETAIIALGAIVGEASMADSMEDWPPPAAITTFADGDPAENGWVSDAPSVELIEIAAYSPEWPVLFEASKECWNATSSRALKMMCRTNQALTSLRLIRCCIVLPWCLIAKVTAPI